MKYLLASVLLVVPTARAEDFKLNLRSDFTPVALVHDGVPGVWFPNVDAEYLLYLRTEYIPKLISLLNSSSQLADAYKSKSTDADMLCSLYKTQSGIWQSTSESYHKMLVDDAGSAWWRQPHVILGFGFTLGVSTSIGMAYAINHTR